MRIEKGKDKFGNNWLTPFNAGILSLAVILVFFLLYLLFRPRYEKDEKQAGPTTVELALEQYSVQVGNPMAIQITATGIPMLELSVQIQGGNFSVTVPASEMLTFNPVVCGFYHIDVFRGNERMARTYFRVNGKGWEKAAFTATRNMLLPLDQSLTATLAGKKPLEDVERDILGTMTGVIYQNFKPTETAIDDLTLEMRVRNYRMLNKPKCNSIKIKLYDEAQSVDLCLTQLGCESNNYTTISETLLEGALTPLPELTYDFSKWVDVKVQFSNMAANIYFNGELRKSIKYQRPMGNLNGTAFRFEGDGEIDYVTLKRTSTDQLIETVDFPPVK